MNEFTAQHFRRARGKSVGSNPKLRRKPGGLSMLRFCTFAACVLASALTVRSQTFPSTGPATREINLICIGDSITESKGVPDYAHNSPPAVLARTLASSLGDGTTVYLANVGRGGTTTADWDGPEGLLKKSAEPKAEKLISARPGIPLVFSIMLGTNDSANKGPRGAPASADQYGKRMQTMVNALVSRHPDCIIFLHHPLWYSQNVHVKTADYEGASAHDRLLSYVPAIDAIVIADEK